MRWLLCAVYVLLLFVLILMYGGLDEDAHSEGPGTGLEGPPVFEYEYRLL